MREIAFTVALFISATFIVVGTYVLAGAFAWIVAGVLLGALSWLVLADVSAPTGDA